MNLNDDRTEAWVEKIAWEVGEKVAVRLEQRMLELLELHRLGCPHARRMAKVACVFAALGAVLGFVVKWVAGRF